jgi:hypothetical protein
MNLPSVLDPIKDSPRFIAYTRGKVPINPKTLAAAMVNNPATGGTFEEAQRAAAQIGGYVGVILGHDLLCLDFDDVVEDGVVDPWSSGK